jgi:hypothetical protein
MRKAPAIRVNGPGAAAEPNKEIHMTTTITTTEYLPDRYDRLRTSAEIMASDPAVDNADSLMNGEALRIFIDTLAEEGVLDGLTDHDADTVAMLVILDFLKGPAQMAWRIRSWLGDDRAVNREDDNTWAVCAVLAEALQLYLLAFAGAEFTEARTNTRLPGRGDTD